MRVDKRMGKHVKTGRGLSLKSATRAVLRGQRYVAKETPRAKRLDYVTLPSLRCLAGLDWQAKGWRPLGLEQ